MTNPMMFGRWLVASALLIGLLSLVGWMLDIPALYGGGLGLAPMRPATAVLFLVAATAFLLERGGSGQANVVEGRGGLRLVLATTVAVAGLAILAVHAPGAETVPAVVRQLLEMGPSGQRVAPPSTLTGAAFTLLGAAVLVRGRAPAARSVLLFGTLAITTFALLGMLFIATIPNTSVFHQLAFPTAVALTLLTLGGLLADPDDGAIGAIRRPGPASIYLRFSLVTAIIVPIVFGWGRVYLHRELAIPVEAGIAIYAVSMMIAFAAVAVLTARTVERLDAGASALLQAAPEAMLVVDSAGTVRRANSEAARLFAANATDLIGTAVDSLVPTALQSVHAEPSQSFNGTDGKRPPRAGRAVLARRRDGSEFQAEVTLSPLESGDGRFVIAAISDVTERDKAQRALFESEARFRETFANAAVGVALVGLAGEWLQVNQNFCELLGYSETELRELTFADVTHPEDLQADLDLLRQLEAGEIPRYELEKRYFHKSGRVVHVLLSASVVRSAEGAPLYYIAIVQDITASKQAQAALADTALLQEAILQGANVSIISTNADGIITTFNRAAERMLGYRAEELVGHSTPSVLHDAAEVEARAAVLSQILGVPVKPSFETFVALARRGVADENEWTYLRKDGERLPVRLSVTAMTAANGEIHGFLGIAADVREQRRAAQSMREALEEKETLLREIHHRVKNNLQVVSSLLSLQATASAHPELKVEFEEARDRVRSMAMIHEQLYRSERLSTIDLLAHLRELVKLQATAHGAAASQVSFVITGDAASVSIDCAIPVGLIANEIISNAFKHGALGPQESRIEVTLKREGPREFTLRVWNAVVASDYPVTLEREGALGLRLVRALLGQIDGRLESDVSQGVAICIRFSDTSLDSSPG